ncbi:MAG: ferredoxin-type protein NapF, partial [Gammaproteobacteria bacterium]|nr:ferredoxin-type protein NapF [Gammaproteobacteria bacterium]
NTFIDICDGCGECIAQCPNHIIKKGRGRYPVIDFNAGECTFCGDCVNACEPKALSYTENQTPWAIIASINTKNCLAFKGIECRSCYDPCEVGSIKIKPQLGGVSIPTLDLSLCTGCGACYVVCPTSAISMSNMHNQ